jgi:phosphate transport system substrate-binding protein
MNSAVRYFFLIFLAVLIYGCKRDASEGSLPTEGRMTIYVDKSLAWIMSQQKNIFELNYPRAVVDLEYCSEKELFRKFIADSAGVIVSCRRLSPEEKEYLHKAQQTHPREYPFAHGAIAFLSSAQAQDSLLTYEQILGLFAGTAQAAGSFAHILVEDKESGIASDLLARSGAQQPSSSVFAVESKSKILEHLIQDPASMAAIDWSEWSDSDRSDLKDTLARLRVIQITRPIDSFQQGYLTPYQYHLTDGMYPFTRELCLITRTGKTDLGTGFASFIAGDIGQKIILKAGLYPKFQSDRWIEFIDSDIKLNRSGN